MAIVLPDAALDELLAPTDPETPAEALRWFRTRAPVSRDVWHAIDERAHRRSFLVARVTALDLLTQVWRAIDRAIAQGTNFTDFKRDATEALAHSWTGDDPAKLNVVFRNNVQLAYSAGRYSQQVEPDVLEERPYWRFEAILDSRTTPICQPLDGVTLLASNRFWSTHYPPLHHQCRSGVTGLTGDQAAEESKHAVPASARPPQTGWGSTPDASEWSPDPTHYPAALWAAFQDWIR